MSSPQLSGDPFRPPKKKKERAPAAAPEKQPEARGPFKIIMTPEAQKGYDGLPGNMKLSMDEIVRRLESWPEVSGVKSFFGKGYAPNKFRMKTWDWRIEFEVDMARREIRVLRIGHRDTFYDEYH